MSKSSRISSAVRSDASDPRKENASDDNRPIHSIRYRNLKGAIWKNAGTNGDFYTVTLSRAYQDKDEQWHDVTSFNSGDLPMLAKLANDCHSWITWQERKAAEEKGGKP